MQNNYSIHIFGSNYPASQYLIDLLKRDKYALGILNIYSYSRNFRKSPNKIHSYDDFDNNFRNNDIIFSFIPINYAYEYMKNVINKNKLPSKLFTLSSTSIYSKVIKGSMDSKEYLTFLIGESKITQLMLPFLDPGHKLFLIRPTLIWGSKVDNNIHFIYKFLSFFRFFPLLKSNNGLRAPIHQNQLALKLFSLMKLNLNSGIYNFQGPCIMSYLEMVKIIQKKVPKKTFIIRFPKNFLLFLISIAKFCNMKLLISKISMVLRQEDDLIYYEEKKINEESENLGSFKEYIESTYE